MIKKYFNLISFCVLWIAFSSMGHCSLNDEGLRLRKPLLKKDQDHLIPKLENSILNNVKLEFENRDYNRKATPDLAPILENYMLFCIRNGMNCDLDNFDSTLTALAFGSVNRERFNKVVSDTFQISKDDLDKYYDYYSHKPREEAKLLILKAAEQGNLEAEFKMGFIYFSKKNVEQDYKQAIYWFEKAAQRGHVLAQYDLGLVYDRIQNLEKAVYWYEKAAQQGNQHAQVNLGVLYYEGEGIKKIFFEAAYWYKKAAEQGNAAAQYNLGLMYLHGQAVIKNVSEARKWFEKSAQQKDRDTCFYLGNFELKAYLYPCSLPEEALIWYMKAAFLGHLEATVKVGLMYYAGIGTPQESFPLLDEAYQEFMTDDLKKWWKEASEEEKACYWWRRAADKGSAEAQFYMGWMYENGYGVKKNDGKDHQKLADEFYQKSAAQGDISALIKLKKATPNDLTQSDRKSFQIWKNLAEKEAGYLTSNPNFVNSIYFNFLGTFHEMGRYTTQGKEKAKELYKVGAKLNKKYNLPFLRMKNDKSNRRHPQAYPELIIDKIDPYSKKNITKVLEKVPVNERQALLEIACKLIAGHNVDGQSKVEIIQILARFNAKQRQTFLEIVSKLMIGDTYGSPRIKIIETLGRVCPSERQTFSEIANKLIAGDNTDGYSKAKIIETLARVPINERQTFLEIVNKLMIGEVDEHSRTRIIEILEKVLADKRQTFLVNAIKLITHTMDGYSRVKIIEELASQINDN